MNWLYALAQPFVWHPARALFLALGWLNLAFTLSRAVRRPFVIAAAAWGLFAALEFEAWRERADIRVDLLITWPALCLITVVCVIVAVKRVLARAVQGRREAA
jgi:hypothetical protein